MRNPETPNAADAALALKRTLTNLRLATVPEAYSLFPAEQSCCVCVCVCESCCKLNVRCKVLSHSRRPVWFSPVEQADLAFRWLLEVLPRWHIALSDFHSPPPPPSHSPHVTYILCRARYLLHRLIVSDSQTSDWFAFVNTDAPDGSARGKILPETVLHWCTLITFLLGGEFAFGIKN